MFDKGCRVLLQFITPVSDDFLQIAALQGDGDVRLNRSCWGEKISDCLVAAQIKKLVQIEKDTDTDSFRHRYR
jgi:hypothetical protein